MSSDANLLPKSLHLHPRSAIFWLILEYLLSLGNREELIFIDQRQSSENFVLSYPLLNSIFNRWEKLIWLVLNSFAL